MKTSLKNLLANRPRKLAMTWLATGLAGACLHAQDPLSKPITEADLLRKLDAVLPSGSPSKTGAEKSQSVAEKSPADSPGQPGVREPDGKRQKGPTEITAEEGSFDNKAHLAVFTGRVSVNDPEFRVVCDKLTAFLKGGDSEESPKSPGAGGKNPESNGQVRQEKSKESGGGLKKAVAEAAGNNRVRIIQEKKEGNGSVSRNTGEGRKAVYDAETGEVTLTGMPWVQQGVNMCVALDEDTVMVLNRTGRMRVVGLHKTVIKESAPEGSR